MANIKSAEKRNRQNIKRRARNRVIHGSTRTAIKQARLMIESGDPGAADAVAVALKRIDKASSKGALHKNAAARSKSRLTRALNRVVG
ncbi:30S ribosomal protein S20 [Chloroflexi bacterium TSY]|nr:30S ribosomal protein S20 [Chloroflexi bacterium TSY]